MNYIIEYEDDYYEEDEELTLPKNKILTKKKNSLEDWIKEKILNNFINDEIQFSS